MKDYRVTRVNNWLQCCWLMVPAHPEVRRMFPGGVVLMVWVNLN